MDTMTLANRVVRDFARQHRLRTLVDEANECVLPLGGRNPSLDAHISLTHPDGNEPWTLYADFGANPGTKPSFAAKALTELGANPWKGEFEVTARLSGAQVTSLIGKPHHTIRLIQRPRHPGRTKNLTPPRPEARRG